MDYNASGLSSGGDHPLTNIKYGSHAHEHQIVNTLGSTTSEDGDHRHTNFVAQQTSTQGWAGEFYKREGRAKGTDSGTFAKGGMSTSIGLETYGEVVVTPDVGKHSHSFQCTLVDDGDMSTQQTQSTSDSQTTYSNYKHYKLYYIIYLPQS